MLSSKGERFLRPKKNEERGSSSITYIEKAAIIVEMRTSMLWDFTESFSSPSVSFSETFHIHTDS